MNNQNLPDDPNVKVEIIKPNGTFTNYIFKAIPLAFDESMSYYETLCALLNYLQETVIPAVNNNGDAVIELQNLYVELKSYVDDAITEFEQSVTNRVDDLETYMNNYFNNLDVQEEINNKLDAMAQDGTLTNLIKGYVDPIYQAYENSINGEIADFKRDVNGDITDQNTEISNFKTSVNSQINSIDDKVDAVSSGSPAGVYATVSDLTSADPDHSKIYLVTADGNWYYYNTTLSSWDSGGTYQATNINNKEIKLNMLEDAINNNLLEKININELGGYITNNTTNTRYLTTPFYITKGTTITASAGFISKYQWRLAEYQGQSTSGLGGLSPRESYTATDNYYACFDIQPLENTTWDIAPNNIDLSGLSGDIYIPKHAKSSLYDLNNNIISQNISFSYMTDGLNTPSGRAFFKNNGRISTNKIIKSSLPIYFKRLNSNISYGISTFSSSSPADFIADTGWKTDEYYIIPANTYFSLSLKHSDNTNFDNEINLDKYIKLSSFAPLDLINNAESYQYEYSGNHINTKANIFNIDKVYDLSTPYSQGSDVYGNYLVIYFLDGSLNQRYFKLYNATTGEYISKILANVEHGDSLQFSNEFYDDDDILPLLYCTSDTTPGICYVYRFITENTGEVVKEFDLPDNIGYYGGCTLDFLNKKLYYVAYYQNAFHDATDNYMIITKFDFSNPTLIEDNKYSITQEEQFTLPFINTIQGQPWFNNLIFCLSGYGNEKFKIVVIDPYRKIISNVFEDFPVSIENAEFEDASFITKNNDTVIWLRDRNAVYELKLN